MRYSSAESTATKHASIKLGRCTFVVSPILPFPFPLPKRLLDAMKLVRDGLRYDDVQRGSKIVRGRRNVLGLNIGSFDCSTLTRLLVLPSPLALP